MTDLTAVREALEGLTDVELHALIVASNEVLLVEEGLWTRHSITPAGMATELHVEGPLAGEPVIVTSESALHALLDGTLTATRATELGVLIVVRPT